MNTDLAHLLSSLGYCVIPTTPTKPCVAWGDAPVWDPSWETRYPAANLALLAGPASVAFIDVDVDNPDVCKSLLKHLDNRKIRTLKRKRTDSPRFACIVRTTMERNHRSASYAGQCVEFFAGNHLLTIDGEHRKDPNSTYFLEPKRLGNIKRLYAPEQLPLFGEEDLRALFARFQAIMPGTPDKPASLPVAASAPTVSVPSSLEDVELNLIMEALDVDDYHDWISLGMALHKASTEGDAPGGRLRGFEDWDAWSSTSQKYPGRPALLAKWSSFSDDKEMSLDVLFRRCIRSTVSRTLTHKEIRTKEEQTELLRSSNVYSQDSLDWMLLNYVMVAKGALIADLSKPIRSSLQTLPNMRDFLRNRKTLITKNSGKTVKEEQVNTFDLWLNSQDRREAWDVTYSPGGPRLVPTPEQPDTLQYNTYQAPDVKVIPGLKDSSPTLFTEHLKYLFPNGGDSWMLNWMAQIIQDPGTRYRTSPLSISLFEGTGRGWLTELLVRLVGASNFATVQDIGELVRPGAKTGYLDGTVLLVINEVYIGTRERFSLLNQLKTLFSDDYQSIDIKYGAQKYNQRIYTRVFLQSNHVNGLVIDKDDSRIQPFINRERPQSREYYDKLYANLKDSDFINHVYTWLTHYPVDTSQLMHSTDTPDRQRVVSSTESATEMAFNQFRDVVYGCQGVFTRKMLFEFLSHYITALNRSGESTATYNPKEEKRLLNYADKLEELSPDGEAVFSFTKPTLSIAAHLGHARDAIETQMKEITKRYVRQKAEGHRGTNLVD